MKIICCLVMFSFSLVASTQDNNLEELIGLSSSHDGITFQVESNGCTNKSYFEVQIQESLPPRLQLVRLKEDTCEMTVPYGLKIFYTWGELELEDVDSLVLVNEIQKNILVRSIAE